MLGLAKASCNGARRVDGVVHASCTDEVSGLDFEFIDTHGDFGRRGKNSSVIATSRITTTTSQLKNMISSAWERAGANATEPDDTAEGALVERGFKNFWRNCRNNISGACSSDHGVAWFGATSSLVQNIISIVSEVNTNAREAKSPRSICAMKEEISGLYGRFCVSWANYNYDMMTDEQIDAMAEECARNCVALQKSYQLSFAPNGVAQYFCYSDRPKGCTADNNIPACPA